MNFHNVEFITSFGRSEQLPEGKEYIEIAFSGKSNVGKSSMINKVFNRKNLARVSAKPGKTITINFFKVENVMFADLPGYGYAKVAKTEKKRWTELIDSYFHTDRKLELVFQLLDMRHKPTDDDLTMINFLIDSGIPFVIILTKQDKLKKMQALKRLEELQKEIPCAEQITMVPFSSLTGEGVDTIKEIVEDIANQSIDEDEFDEDEDCEDDDGENE